MKTRFTHPIEIATSERLNFLERRLPLSGLRLLEVGCGDGSLAAALAGKRVSVTALDVSETAIKLAKKRGVHAVHADFLHYREDKPYDAILFSRCLHHIQPPSAAIAVAKGLLKPTGTLVVDDFAAELADEQSVSWLRHVELLLSDVGALKAAESNDCLVDPLQQWHHDHFVEHGISKSGEMVKAIRADFSIAAAESGPYLFHYVIDKLKQTKIGFELAKRVLSWERDLIKDGLVKPIGVRLIATSRASK